MASRLELSRTTESTIASRRKTRAGSGLRLWPVVDSTESFTHKRCPFAVRQTVGDTECLNPLFVRQHSNGARPVGAPHAAIDAKSVEYLAERIPNVFVREGLMRQGAGTADFYGDVVVGCEREQFRQLGADLPAYPGHGNQLAVLDKRR